MRSTRLWPGIRPVFQAVAAALFSLHPTISAADAEVAMKRFQLPPGLKVQLIASEPLLANPVGFCIDYQGRFYVAETYRHSAVGAAFRNYEGVLDIRSHPAWLTEDLACRTVEDRVALLKKNLGPDIAKMTVESEKVRLLEDLNHDGVLDHSVIFAEGFNGIPDGIGASVSSWNGSVVFSCIPDLWSLTDTNGDGRADLRKSVFTGFGVHIGFLGHDLHGLRMGPDGRLYFSIGDRGLNVATREGTLLKYPDEGVVLRCEPDGSKLEVFARGLRNPQDLAFDDQGNLFTGDNNSDGGDRARWVYVVEGGDSGWRIGYQHLAELPRRGPWNAERLWHPQWPGQAAYIVPPLANLGYGPSGCAFYPGTGLPDHYQRHFWLCDFRGGASSGVHTFTLKAKGAAFELATYEQFVWEALPTDIDFGVDGGIYFTDWVEGWNKTGKGRIYRIFDPGQAADPLIFEVKKLLAAGMRQRGSGELIKLLGHADMRVRMEAQFELAGRREFEALQTALQRSRGGLAQLHAIWGCGQLLRHPDTAKSVREILVQALLPMLASRESEVRAQVARVLGDARVAESFAALVKLLADESPRVQFFAAISLASLRNPEAMTPLLGLLERNQDKDPYLRHAAVKALAGLNAPVQLLAAAAGKNRSTRLGVVVALRRMENPQVATFLGDDDIGVALEAARAIHDVPIPAAIHQLASLARSPSVRSASPALTTPRPAEEPRTAHGLEAAISSVAPRTGWTTPWQQLVQRVINANYLLGTADAARALADLAGLTNEPASVRVDALRALAAWPESAELDRLTGQYRGARAPEPGAAAFSLEPFLEGLLRDPMNEVKTAAIEAVQRLRVTRATGLLAEIARRSQESAPVRVAALNAIAVIGGEVGRREVQSALDDPDSEVQSAAVRLRAAVAPAEVIFRLKSMLERSSFRDKQRAFATLSTIHHEDVDSIFSDWLDKSLLGRNEPTFELDLLEGAAKRADPKILARLRKFEESRSKDFMGAFRESLFGGSPEAGRKLFFEREEVFCSRCHQINGEGGEAGPKLTGIGARQTREYILESIVFPNSKIAAGWENVIVALNDGRSYAGLLKKETESEIALESPEDGSILVKKSEVKSRERALSAMPEEFRHVLSKRDLRDLVEFLASSR